jgi:hypothetical protein
VWLGHSTWPGLALGCTEFALSRRPAKRPRLGRRGVGAVSRGSLGLCAGGRGWMPRGAAGARKGEMRTLAKEKRARALRDEARQNKVAATDCE